MSQDNLVKLQCSETGDINYFTHRNKKTGEKLELRKFSPRVRKHTIHKEMKK